MIHLHPFLRKCTRRTLVYQRDTCSPMFMRSSCQFEGNLSQVKWETQTGGWGCGSAVGCLLPILRAWGFISRAANKQPPNIMISPGARCKRAVGEGLVFIFSFRDPWCKMVKEPCSFGSHGGRPSPEVKCKSWRVGTKPSCSVLGDQKYDCHMVLKIWKSSTGEVEAGGLWVTHNEFQASLWCRARPCYKTAKQRRQTKPKHRPWVKEHQKPPSR